MTTRYATVAELRRTISTEILVAAGLQRTGLLQALLRPLVWPPAHRFAHLAAEFDRRVALEGWTAAARWGLSRFVDGFQAQGTEHLRQTGPLVIASNHPGSYDVLVISAALARDDLKILVSDVPFFRHLYATSPHLIYTELGPDSHARMAVARESVRHLQSGGALLVYATGRVDPDPALLPGSEEALQTWSASLSLFLRRVPQACLVPAIVRGVLAASCFAHPLTRLRREPRQKQFLAEFIQVGQQVLFGRGFGLSPTVHFARPLTSADLAGSPDARAAIITRAQELLAAN